MEATIQDQIEIINAKWLSIEQIEPNEGQIEGIPSNPRTIDPDDFETLKKSITDNPQMLGLRDCYVKEHQGSYVMIDGNMRLKALQELGFTQVVCKVIPESWTPSQVMQTIIKSNLPYGDWDTTKLMQEWDMTDLQDWFGDKLPEFPEDPEPSSEEGSYTGADSNYHIVYELVFSDEAEQSRWYDFIAALRRKFPDADTISERVLFVVADWMQNHQNDNE